MVNSGLCVASIPSFRNTFPISNILFIPPIQSLFNHNSGAIRSSAVSSLSIAVQQVSKGFAFAPLDLDEMMGVSTSTNYLLYNHSLILLIIRCRMYRVSVPLTR